MLCRRRKTSTPGIDYVAQLTRKEQDLGISDIVLSRISNRVPWEEAAADVESRILSSSMYANRRLEARVEDQERAVEVCK